MRTDLTGLLARDIISIGVRRYATVVEHTMDGVVACADLGFVQLGGLG